MQLVNTMLGRNSPVLNFAYHLPKPWTDRFAHVDGNQLQKSRKCFFFGHSPSPYLRVWLSGSGSGQFLKSCGLYGNVRIFSYLECAIHNEGKQCRLRVVPAAASPLSRVG